MPGWLAMLAIPAEDTVSTVEELGLAIVRTSQQGPKRAGAACCYSLPKPAVWSTLVGHPSAPSR